MESKFEGLANISYHTTRGLKLVILRLFKVEMANLGALVAWLFLLVLTTVFAACPDHPRSIAANDAFRVLTGLRGWGRMLTDEPCLN